MMRVRDFFKVFEKYLQVVIFSSLQRDINIYFYSPALLVTLNRKSISAEYWIFCPA